MDWMPPWELAGGGDAWEEHGFIIMEAAAGDGWGGMILCNPQYFTSVVCCIVASGSFRALQIYIVSYIRQYDNISM
jgi:hypothetical protein